MRGSGGRTRDDSIRGDAIGDELADAITRGGGSVAPVTPRSLVAATALVALFAKTATSHAQPSSTSTAEIARNHIQNGGRYYQLRRFAEAAREFQAAWELTRRPEVLFNLGHALEDAGRDREALDAYERFDASGASGVDRQSLLAHMASLRTRLARTATATTTTTTPPPRVTPEPPRVLPPPPPAPRSLALPVTLLSAGGALLVTGLALGLTVSSTWSDLNARCQNRVCDPSLQSDASGAEMRATVADVLGGVGVAAIAAGVVVLLLPQPQASAPRVGLMCTGDGCAGRLAIAF